MEVPPAETADLIHRARIKGSRIILNLAPAAAISEAALREVDILVVNETESAALAGHLGVLEHRTHFGFGRERARDSRVAGAFLEVSW